MPTVSRKAKGEGETGNALETSAADVRRGTGITLETDVTNVRREGGVQKRCRPARPAYGEGKAGSTLQTGTAGIRRGGGMQRARDRHRGADDAVEVPCGAVKEGAGAITTVVD